MTQIILNSAPGAVGTTPDGGSTAHAPDGPAGDLFRAALAAQAGAPVAAATVPQSLPSARTGAVVVDPKAQIALEGKINKMIAAGMSQADIIASIAATVAASIAPELDAPGAAARSKLEAVFAAALAPPGDSAGSTGSVAERVRTLAKRALHITTMAQSLIANPTGQQNVIAGNLLDAQRVKETPARPTTDATTAPQYLAVSLNGVPSPAVSLNGALVPASSSNVPALGAALGGAAPQVASTAPAAPAAAAAQLPDAGVVATALASTPRAFVPPPTDTRGDGRTVNIGSKTAIAGDGDTGLGRILTRAALAADARAPIAPDVRAPIAGDVRAPIAPDVRAPIAADVRAPIVAAPVTPGGTSIASGTSAASADATIAAFVKSFEAALKSGAQTDEPKAVARDAQAVATTPVAHDVTASTALTASTAFAPAVAPFSIDRAGASAPSAPAAAAVPLDHSAIADQVLRGAFLKNTGASSEMRLTLVPESLGDVNVKLVINAGTVTAHVTAETPEVRDALINAQPQLTKSLADAGLKLSSFTVDVSGGGFAGFAQQQNDQWQNGNRSRRPLSLAGDDGLDDNGIDAIPTFGPSIVARPNVGDYNYLA